MTAGPRPGAGHGQEPEATTPSLRQARGKKGAPGACVLTRGTIWSAGRSEQKDGSRRTGTFISVDLRMTPSTPKDTTQGTQQGQGPA